MSQAEEIATRLRREMNGAVSQTMRTLDPSSQRKINFGVSLTTIKQICSQYPKDRETAKKLRERDVREWWLAAAYIDTPQDITQEYADFVASGWVSEEEANVYGMELIGKSPMAAGIAKKWFTDENRLKKIAAGRIVALLAPELNGEKASEFVFLTTAQVPTCALYEHHTTLRKLIRQRGPYEYSWILDEIDYDEK